MLLVSMEVFSSNVLKTASGYSNSLLLSDRKTVVAIHSPFGDHEGFVYHIPITRWDLKNQLRNKQYYH